MSYKYAIQLGGSIDSKSVNKSIKTIEKLINPINLKVVLDMKSIQNQLNKMKFDFKGGLSSASSSKTSKTPQMSADNIPIGKQEGETTRTSVYDKENDLIKQSIDLLDDKANKIKEVYTVGKNGSLELTSTTKKEGELLQQNSKAYENIGERIKRLGEQGIIGKKAVNGFNDELAKADKLQNQLAKNKAFTQLNQQISDSKKQVMSFGQQLSVAVSKMAIWSVATLAWYKTVNILKDMVKEVIALDKAFTGLQMVTQSTTKELETMKDTYISMAKEFKTSVSEVTSAAEDYLRAGMSIVDTNKLIETSLVLSKVGMMSSADATTYMISTMRAYKMDASEMMSVVDKLSAVDVAASVSSEGLSIALSKTASSARLAGVELDRMYGYIAAVQEVSQESSESIGNFFKTLFARMQQVKIGSLVDEEGQDISNVSRVLDQYGISVMDTTGDLRDMGDVLDELSGEWDDYTNAQKSEIATTLAGKRKSYARTYSNIWVA